MSVTNFKVFELNSTLPLRGRLPPANFEYMHEVRIFVLCFEPVVKVIFLVSVFTV